MRNLIWLLTICASAQTPMNSVLQSRVSAVIRNSGSGAGMGNAVATVPPSSGLVIWTKPETLGAAGSAVTIWTDSSGSGNTLTVTTGSPVVVGNAYYGYSSVRSTDNQNGTAFAPPALTLSTASWSAFYAIRHRGGANGTEVMMQGDGLGYIKPYIYFHNHVAQANFGDQLTKPLPGQVAVVGWASSSIWVSDANRLITNFVQGTETEIMTGMAQCFCDIFEILVYNRGLSSAEVDTVMTYFGQRYGAAQPVSGDTRVTFDGNSLVAGQFAFNSAFRLMQQYFQFRHTWVNTSQPGLTTPQCDTNATSQIDPFIGVAAGKANQILLIWELTNDATGQTPAQVLTHIQTYVANRRAANPNVKVVVLTAIDRNSLTGQMQAVNAAVRGATPFWDALADVGNDPNIGAFAGNSANAYFAGDGIHLSDLGQAVVAQYCIAALQSLGVY